ncbi:GH92 family glycosyl hydrolase [Nocardioides sp. NBC_00368]|uniref:GH92 family glycosyl hydrolase n=1 Tax=Nocardioides sp. NBC_00368 TaxID=2976000 RepID=UPI002E248B93
MHRWDAPPRTRGRAARLAAMIAASAALMVGTSGTVPAFATPEAPEPSAPKSDTADPQRAAEGGDWETSFEEDDPQPTWADLVDTDEDGNARTEGVAGPDAFGIPGGISEHVTGVTASGENTGSGEGAAELVDGDINTKWLTFATTGWVQIRLDQPVKVVRYALTSANDAAERDPKDWVIQGSTDGQTWTTVDTRTGQSWDERFQTREFEIASPQAYSHYRIDISANQSGGIIQLAEWQLSDGSEPPPPLKNMTSHPDDGPASAYAAKSKVGFTGVHAFEYAGKITADKGHSYNRVFDVDIPVGKETELSYLVFPEFIDGDLSYPSTYTAVDLAFTDGTLLSELGALDAQGYVLSPKGQGESKSLYTNQWNKKTSVIGEVAAGRTIDRILVAVDAPSGPTKFRGWYDDIAITASPEDPQVTSSVDYAVTTRGTQSSGSFSRGNNIPATAVPHGFNFWAPMTNAGSLSWFYRYHQDNDAQNRTSLQALTLSHETSPWMGDRQTFQVMPSSAEGVPDPGRKARALTFEHDNETARPYYYKVGFDNGQSAEIAPTDHAAVFRFTYPGDSARLVFDNVNNNGGLTLDQANGTLSGFTDTRSGLSNGATRMYVYATFDQPVIGGGKYATGERPDVQGHLAFDAGADRTVTMRIATSLIGIDQAKRNLELEIADDDFETVKEKAKALWQDKLDVLDIQGATKDQRTTVYSNLARLFLYPNSGHENTGTEEEPVWKHAVQSTSGDTNPPGTTPTHTGAEIKDGKVYVNNGFWDTYRTTWAAYSLLEPSQAAEMVNGFVQQYKDNGWISRWSSPGYANLMTGTSSDVSFADAYVKGVEGIDAEAAYAAAVKNATVRPPGSATNSNVGRKGMQTSVFLGYTPAAVSEGVSWGLEGYINDYGIGNMAAKLAARDGISSAERKRLKEESEYFLGRARNYVNTFDTKVGFFQGRNADGTFKKSPADYNPLVWGSDHDYTETNGWNFAFHTPQDGQGLANLYGGRGGLAKKLDTFFATPETGEYPGSYGGIIHEIREARDVRMGQWGFSNQVSHHIPWMYSYTGQPWKTQEIVRETLRRMYTGSEIGQGYAGDEDNGETSAWHLFASLGLYPLQMGSENLVLGSPLFTEATLHLEGGKDLVIKAPDNSTENIYVQGVTIDGKAWDKTYVSHKELADGGTIEFDMGPRPSRWGTSPSAVPPSLTTGSEPARPIADKSGAGRGTVTASGNDGETLVDNDSGTQTTVAGDGWVEYRFSGTKVPVSFYTLTNGADGRSPRGWVVKGSNDGTDWKVLDRRSGEKFDWQQATRPFKLESESRFNRIRIEFTGPAAEPITLAEVELLG